MIIPYYCLILSIPLVQALLCVIRTSIIAFQQASLLLVSLFYMLSSKCFKWSYSWPPKYVHFFACFLKAILWTWNSKEVGVLPHLFPTPQWQQLVLFMWYFS